VKRLLVDLKENCHGEIVGRVSLPADSLFVLEALAEVIEQLSKSCGVAPLEIATDLVALVRKGMT
jgi:hypothetical protein